MPDVTMASAIPRIISSLTLQPNLFQLFQPMGGVSARLAETEEWSCAKQGTAHSSANSQHVSVFMALSVLPEESEPEKTFFTRKFMRHEKKPSVRASLRTSLKRILT